MNSDAFPSNGNQNAQTRTTPEPRRTNLALPIGKLLKDYREAFLPSNINEKEETFIHVDEIASKVARFYEKIRKIIDWKDDNILRRNAIERILKRAFITEISSLKPLVKIDSEKIAEPLILELIRGGHLPNDTISSKKIDTVAGVLDKYFYILKNAHPANTLVNYKKKVNFYNWILEIAACEIEEILSPPVRESALIKAMTAIINEKIKVLPEGAISREDQLTQTYVAVHRTLYDLDNAIIAYYLLKAKYPQWDNRDKASVMEITQNISSILESIDKDLNHPLAKEFFNLCERMDTVFTILGDILDSFKNEPGELTAALSDKNNYKKLITKFYNERLNTLKKRLFRLAVFSTLSVFVSNWFTFFIIEVPVAHLFYEGFSLLAATVDFVVPSLAMFILVSIIQPPSANNLEEVIKQSSRYVYQDEGKDFYEIKPKKKKGTLTNFIINLLYLIGFGVTLGAIAYAFKAATIPITSVAFDTMQIALNIFAALVIRNKAKEITMEEKTSFWEFLLDILSLPVAEAGSFIANKWKEYNLVAVFFNVFIEIPFVSFIEFVENWRNFLKERKANIH